MSVFGAWFSYLLLFYVFSLSQASWGAEPKVEIRTPKDGARIAQEQNTILISGKVSTGNTRTANVDIFFVLDISGSTAHYAGVGLGDANLPAPGRWDQEDPRQASSVVASESSGHRSEI